ncbi:MAG: MBL fold metallo-hydrolase [Pseudomonadota bacterium]|nr:MBL fold metallo-hydrolase [Pseudomonadota bacterium]
MLFRQIFDPASSTYTYLVACSRTREAALVDPVLEQVEVYVALLGTLDLTLSYSLETHVHADHVTAAASLRDRLGCRTAVHRDGGATCADLQLTDGDLLSLGDLVIEVRATPGHTASCVSYYLGDRVFTGDALLIAGCGRTDFQQGDPGRLYDSVRTRIFTLPPDTLVYPAHDYKGRTVSTVKEEMATNPRLSRPRDEFVHIMDTLALAPPKQIDRALPANQACGRESTS